MFLLTVCTGYLCPQNYPSLYDLYSAESDVKPPTKYIEDNIKYILGTKQAVFRSQVFFTTMYYALSFIQKLNKTLLTF